MSNFVWINKKMLLKPIGAPLIITELVPAKIQTHDLNFIKSYEKVSLKSFYHLM